MPTTAKELNVFHPGQVVPNVISDNDEGKGPSADEELDPDIAQDPV